MTIAETERQRFNEEANIFERYLPYAIVYDCVDKWAKAFEGLEGQPATQTSGWYVGSGVFMASSFSRDVNSFSSSISTAIASTPGGSGGSGFSAAAGFRAVVAAVAAAGAGKASAPPLLPAELGEGELSTSDHSGRHLLPVAMARSRRRRLSCLEWRLI